MNRAKLLRYERGLTSADVASGAGISPTTLRSIEDGDEPTAPVAKKLAGFYEVPVAFLLGLEEREAA